MKLKKFCFDYKRYCDKSVPDIKEKLFDNCQTEIDLPKKKMNMKSIVIAVVAIFITVALFTGAAAAGYVYVPGIGYNNKITHSFDGPIVVEKNGYTHKIVNCYVINKRVFLNIILYKTAKGLKLENNFPVKLEENNLPSCYRIYQEGVKYEKYTTDYGNTIDISTDIKAKKNKTVELELYSGGEFLTKLELLPISKENEKFADRPYSKVDDISLSAECTRHGRDIEVFVGAILPSDAVLDAFVYFSKNGYYLNEIYAMDKSGNIYRSKSDMTYYPSNNDEAAIGQIYHIYYFDVPENIDELTIIVNKISYFSRTYKMFSYSDELISKKGPWKIKIMLN